MRKFLIAILMATTIATSATPALAGDSTLFGTAAGAALGGFVGSQVSHGAARLPVTVAGVVLGGMAGNSIGHAYERRTYYPTYSTGYYAEPAYYTPPVYRSGYVPNYVAPEYVEPVYAAPTYYAPTAYAQPTYVDNNTGHYCREYSQRTQIGTQTQESYGTACMQPDGSWRIISRR